MKKKSGFLIFFALVFLLAGCECRPRIVKVASFNIRIFSNNSRDDQELNLITDVLRDYDLIAIQELRDEEVLKRTIDMLKNKGREYAYEISDKVGRGVKERYAFLYRKDKFEVLKKGKIYQGSQGRFIREPFYATFKSGNFDFTLVTIHTLFGSGEADRRPEIVELSTVYQKIQDEDPTEQDIILCGDFNFPPVDIGFDNLRSMPGMVFLFGPPVKTTVTDTSLYDNFWFQNSYVKEYIGSSGINKFDELMFNNDDAVASLAVSDHRPIWAEFNISNRDDD